MTRITSLLSLLVATVPACDESGCFEVSRTVVTEPDEPLFIGGTYGDALATAVGERTASLVWLNNERLVRGFPEPGETELTVTVHEPSEAQNIEFEKRARRNERLFCPNFLVTDLEIDIETADGALDTTVVTEVAFMGPGYAQVYTELTDLALGSLQFDPVSENAKLWLSFSLNPTSLSEDGALILSDHVPGDEGDGAGMLVDLATWTFDR